MKYWKGYIGTTKEGQCGTMDDLASVPDSVEIPKAEYDAWMAIQPATVIPDHKSQYLAATTDAQRLRVIATLLGLE